VDTTSRLGGLDRHILDADLINLQNVMNPEVLGRTTATGRAVVTIQDHRVFCPGIGKTMPDGRPCRSRMGVDACHECLPDSDYLDRLLKLTTARRDALNEARLVVLSKWMAEELALVDLPHAEVIPPWVSVGPVLPGPRRGIVMAGRLVSHKGLMDGWEAWQCSDAGQPMVIAGEGPLGDAFDGAEMLGWLPNNDLKERLRSSIALVFPSHWQEPFGMLGVEALAEGTPVVVADSGGTAEWSDVGCIRVPRGDVEAMAAAIRRIVGDESLARRLGDEGRSMVAERFQRGPIEARLSAVYGSVEAG
jgi:glycosyltransferase involved in cell wall biosynthesis